MTETDKLNGLNYHFFLSCSSVSTVTNDSSFFNNFLSPSSRFSDSSETNLNDGIAANITNSFVQHEERLLTRKRW